MKKIFSFLVFCIMIFSFTNSQSQAVIDALAKNMAKNVVKEMKNLPEDAKVAIAFFSYDNTFTDTIKTYLSKSLTTTFVQELKINMDKKNFKQKILFPDNNFNNNLFEAQQNYIFTVPDNADKAKYWQEFNDNQIPDYFIVGTYQFGSNYSTITIKNVQLKPSPFSKYSKNKEISVPNLTVKIKKPADKTSLAEINQPISILSPTYTNLIEWSGEADFLSLKLIDSNSLTVSNSELVVGDEYQISITLKEDANIYAFFFDPADKNFPYISMLYPFQKNQDTFLKAGTHSIPPGHTFIPDPPAEGQVFIKIIASKEKLPITFTEETDSEGYIVSKFNDKNCTDFLAKLNAASKDKISSRQITLLRTEK